jgi:hypothetical protein
MGFSLLRKRFQGVVLQSDPFLHGRLCLPGIDIRQGCERDRRYDRRMDSSINPPLVVKDTPKPRRIRSLAEAREYVDEQLRRGRPPPWRETAHKLDTAVNDDDAIEAVGALRELLEMEDLLVPPELPLVTPRRRS